MAAGKEKRTRSDSAVQKQAEQVMIEWLSKELGVPLSACCINDGACRMNVDAHFKDSKRVVLGEAWAHIGKAKSAQKNKVMTDVLKLAYIRDCMLRQDSSISVECYYVFADAEAAEVLSSASSWNASAGRHFKVQPKVAPIPIELRLAIAQAQKHQDIREE